MQIPRAICRVRPPPSLFDLSHILRRAENRPERVRQGDACRRQRRRAGSQQQRRPQDALGRLD